LKKGFNFKRFAKQVFRFSLHPGGDEYRERELVSLSLAKTITNDVALTGILLAWACPRFTITEIESVLFSGRELSHTKLAQVLVIALIDLYCLMPNIFLSASWPISPVGSSFCNCS